MLQLKSNFFRTREDLCDYVNSQETQIEVVQITATALGFVLFYREVE